VPAPNVSFTVYRNPWSGELAVGVITLDAIKRGAELLANYGHHFWSADEPQQSAREPPQEPLRAAPVSSPC
jgi:hypothetical protein